MKFHFTQAASLPPPQSGGRSGGRRQTAEIWDRWNGLVYYWTLQ
ncbi:MAG: hypothetical protein RRZ73_06390 [Oscillospiraceae bacterium]